MAGRDNAGSDLANLEYLVRVLERRVIAAETALSRLTGPYKRVFLARRDPAHRNQWKEWTVAGGAVRDFTAGRQCTGDDQPCALLGLGELTPVLEVEDVGAYRYVPLVPDAAPFVVSLTKVSGAANPVSYGYDVRRPGTGTLLYQNATPLWRPYRNGDAWVGHVPVPAIRGLAYYDSNGSFVLLQAYESYPMNLGCAAPAEGSA